jgi:penicillin-binding protein 1A
MADNNNPYNAPPYDSEYDSADVPPGDIGDPGPIPATVRPHRKTLLDVILGQ